MKIGYYTGDEYGADGWWEEGDDPQASAEVEARKAGFSDAPRLSIADLSEIQELSDDEFDALATAWGLAFYDGWTSADSDDAIRAEYKRRECVISGNAANRALTLKGEEGSLPDLPHLSCPAGNQWSKFEWSKADGDAESCQCGGCGTWQSAEEAWKQCESQNQETK